MNSQKFVLLSLFATVLILGVAHGNEVVGTSEDKDFGETQAFAEPSGVEVDPTRAITPYDYRAMMLRSVGKAFQCWRCSSPCSAYACCNDGYPQCCLVNGRCMCCRF